MTKVFQEAIEWFLSIFGHIEQKLNSAIIKTSKNGMLHW